LALVVNCTQGVTLVGGGTVPVADLTAALTLAPVLVAADGGANILADFGYMPSLIIGDMDSVRADLKRIWAHLLHPIAEQDSTDFDKCLRSIASPFVLGVGFTGARLDHTLSAMTALVRHGSSRVILLSEQDVCFLAPPAFSLPVTLGARISLFPMGPVGGVSEGLFWPIQSVPFTPGGIIGTSNKADAAQVVLRMDAPAMLVMLERDMLDTALDALLRVPDWPLQAKP
jgi:thiamine pyrophosphokinase